MGYLNQSDRELLSAYIDDVLESAERSCAEQLLATNAAAAQYVQGLRTARQCLKSVPASPLRSSLTARVLEQAHAQALAEGLPNDHHVFRAHGHAEGLGQWMGLTTDSASRSSTGQADVVPSTRHQQQSARRFSSGKSLAWSALAVAAAVVAGLAVLPLMPGRQPDNVVAEHVPRADTTAGVPTTDEAERSPFDSIASKDASLATSAGRDDSELGQPGLPREPDEVAHVMQGEGALDALKDDLAASEVPALDFLMIIDAVLSPEGWETGRFEQLLDEFGIPVAGPIVTDQEFIEVLEETRVVVSSAEAAPGDEQPRAALIYLRADGATLDRLYQTMHQDRESFPQVVTDVSIGENAELHKLLREQALSRPQSGPLARMLSATGGAGSSEEVVPQFVPAEREDKRSSKNVPAPSAANLSGLGLGGSMPMFEALVILREPNR